MRALGNKDSRNIVTWITYTTFEASSFADTTPLYEVTFRHPHPRVRNRQAQKQLLNGTLGKTCSVSNQTTKVYHNIYIITCGFSSQFPTNQTGLIPFSWPVETPDKMSINFLSSGKIPIKIFYSWKRFPVNNNSAFRSKIRPSEYFWLMCEFQGWLFFCSTDYWLSSFDPEWFPRVVFNQTFQSDVLKWFTMHSWSAVVRIAQGLWH